MIRLEIGGEPVALGNDAAFDFFSYNALLDRENSRGEFTYDIDIDLRNPQNAKVYKHLNRINNILGFSGRSASVIVDGLIFAQGKEVILECDDNIAKIQIVCDSHMYEHVFNENIRISELDLGQLPEYTASTALATLNAEPLSVPAVCTPVLMKNTTPDNYSFTHSVDNYGHSSFDARDMLNFASITDLWGDTGSWQDNTQFVGQPYLVVVVEKVLQALGWTLKYNVLRQMEYAKRMIVIHGYFDTRDINKMIPDWTVAEFFEQIQRMFNVIFVCNKTYGTVSVVSAGSFYAYEAPVVNIDKKEIIRIDNNPSRKFEGLDDLVYEYKGLKYDLPNEDYGNRADISDEIHKLTSLIYISDFSEINSFNSQYRTQEYYNKPYFFFNPATNTKWMLAKGRDEMSFKYRFVRVDQFAHVRGDESVEDGDETELKIVPVETQVVSIQQITENETVRFAAGVVVPYTRSVGATEINYVTDEEHGLNEWVGGSLPEARNTQSENMYVAQFLGRTSTLYDHWLDQYSDYPKAKYPQVFTHRYIDGYVNYRWYDGDWQGSWTQMAFDALWDKPDLEAKITFDLNDRWLTTYNEQLPFRNTEIHTICFKCKTKLDVNSIFNIAGRQFACVSLQYQVSGGKLLPYITGTFLPLL